jgi:hypothetical protein
MRMNKPFLYRYGEPKTYEVIPQDGVTLSTPVGFTGYNCCWDATLSPDGIFYLSLGSEGGEGNYARLNRYNERDNRIENCFYSKDYLAPSSRALPGSKFHSCIDFLPDGRLIMNNHTTDKAPQHPEWLPYAYHSHVWDGFPGSCFFTYDPRTGIVQSLGIPVPHETIYGSVYSKKKHALYMIGFIRGHLYKFDLTTHETIDFGKAIETCSHRMHIGPDENVYVTSGTGYLMRINTDTDTLEWTGVRLPEHLSDYSRRFTLRYASTFLNLDDRRMLMVAGYSNHLLEYNVYTEELRDYGGMHGADELFEGFGNYFYCFNADLDAQGVLWYAMTPRLLDVPEQYAANTAPAPAYLYRWDWSNPAAVPENLGVMGTHELICGIISEIRIDRKRDVLFASCAADTDNGPPVMRIDLKKLRAHAGERGPAHNDRRFYPKPKPPKSGHGPLYEGSSLTNKHEAFRPEQITKVRLWTHLRGDEKNSAVRGLYWDGNTLHGVTGETEPKYGFTIRDGEVKSIRPLSELTDDERAALLRRACPPLTELAVTLPHVAGRQYLAVPSCMVPWNGGRTLVGTRDGKLSLVDGADVCCYGLAAPVGPVRALCVNAGQDFAWGAAGDEADIGRLFTFDEKHGIRELGFLKWILPGTEGIVCADVFDALAVTPDGKTLAIGSHEWLGTVFLAAL